MVGAGAVAARRVGTLLDAGARVRLIAPAAHAELRDLAEKGLIDWQRRDYAEADLDEAWLVHTATGCPATDARVGADAEARRLWCVNATDHASASAWTPAVARFDDVVVAVNTAADPRRAAAIRDAIRLSHATGALPLRHRRPAHNHSEQGALPGTPAGTRATPGRIALVGGGPGDSGLVTVRGRALLAEADVVVADRLGPRGLLAELDPAVRVIEVGKAPGAHLATQEEINRILVAEARAGHLVVRLKGGDPYVLGRGGEEAAYCRARGIDVEVVPGVTSAVSVPAAAGIPVTHRGLATGFTVVTGHQDLGAVPVRQDHTLVLLMGIARLAESVAGLLARGMDPATPVGIIERGWTTEQRVCIGTLETIAADAARAGIGNPAVIVVGDVVSLSPYAATAPETAPAPPRPPRSAAREATGNHTPARAPSLRPNNPRKTPLSQTITIPTTSLSARCAWHHRRRPGRRLRRGHPDQVRTPSAPALEVSIDLFDRYPAPYGLIRYGVAPDHPRIKGIVNALHKVLDRGDIRFLGNVTYGRDLTLTTCASIYDAVIFATGAIKDADLNIPGIDLEGSFGAADFVSWYDGHPDVPREWPLEAKEIAVIGNGNVALDVARMLAKHADDLLVTEIPENVLRRA